MTDTEKRIRMDYSLAVLMNATIITTLLWMVGSGEITKRIALMASVLDAVLLNIALVWTIRVRNKRKQIPSSPRLSLVCVSLGIFAVLATSAGLQLTPDPRDLRGLALSNTPLGEIHPEQKRLFVELVRRREQRIKDQQHYVQSIKPIRPALYSLESFASAVAIRSTSEAMQRVIGSNLTAVEQDLKDDQDFHDRIMHIEPRSPYLKAIESWSGTEKELYLLERQWLSSLTELYAFAGNPNHSGSGTPVRPVRVEFVERFKASLGLQQELQKKVQAANQQFERSRAGAGFD